MAEANTADALMAIRRLVFDEKKVDATGLLQALRQNFKGDEPLRQQLHHGAEKYGNGSPGVDAIAREISNHFIDVMNPG